MAPDLSFTILRHGLELDENGLSRLQREILHNPAPVRVFSAPTGAGKSYALIRAAQAGQRVLFIVPTRRLAQNLANDAAAMLEPSWPDAPNPVAIWSSDETSRQRSLDPGYRPMAARARQVRQVDDERFIVATPEAVAGLLLRAASDGPGSDPFGVSIVVNFMDYIVFDEFHAIEARGFGLCALFARACVADGVRTRLTFLSATPVDILPVLTALGIDASKVATLADEVLDTPRALAQARSKVRVLHGDVRVSFVGQPCMVALLDQHEDEMRACLGKHQQVVAVFDRLEELQIHKARLAAAFDRLGVPAERRLAINSIDDGASFGSFDGLFVTNRSADPDKFDVLVATSSLEMGVTLRAGMLVMDPGHDAMSFVQRIGRVARTDVPGLVVVRADEGRLARCPWLRQIMLDLARRPDLPELTVTDFGAIALAAARGRFEPHGIGDDQPPRSFRSMPQRAVWAACLFWHALERAAPRFARGQREVLAGIRPVKVGVIAAKLAVLLDTAQGQADYGSKWARKFLDQASVQRSFTPTVTVVEPNGKRSPVPLHFIESRPGLRAMPMVADEKGGWTLHLDRPLTQTLRDEVAVYRERRRVVALPNGQDMTVPALEAAACAIRHMQDAINHPGTSARLEEQLKAAIGLVQLSGLIPDAADPEQPGGTGLI